jgi:single-stranded DNA-binding protein
MSNETTITITGNLVDDPELRCTPAGQGQAGAAASARQSLIVP